MISEKLYFDISCHNLSKIPDFGKNFALKIAFFPYWTEYHRDFLSVALF